MSALREAARGKPCRVRLPGICNRDPATTVLAHIRMPGDGIGTKPPDTCATWACSACHDAIDGRVRVDWMPREALELAAWQGVGRTLRALDRDGWRMVRVKQGRSP